MSFSPQILPLGSLLFYVTIDSGDDDGYDGLYVSALGFTSIPPSPRNWSGEDAAAWKKEREKNKEAGGEHGW